MSSDLNQTENLSEELPDEALESVSGGHSQERPPIDTVAEDTNPPAEVASPSLFNLDPSSARQSSRY